MSRNEHERLAELVATYPPSDPDALSADPVFVLVERSIYDGSYYLTGHDSAAGAANYHDSQEYAEDWTIVKLVDLTTGEELTAVPNTIFEVTP